MVESRRTAEPLPLYGQVRLDRMDVAAERFALELIRTGLAFATEIAGVGNEDQIARLCEGVAEALFAGTAREGMKVKALTAGRTATGRIHEIFIEELRDVADLAIRAMLPICGARAMHAHIVSVPFATGEDMHGFAVDHLANRGKIAHGLFSAIAGSDRSLFSQAVWLTTGTVDDHSCSRCESARVENWSDQLGKELAGSIHEHIAELLAAEHRACKAALTAAKRGSLAYHYAGIDPLEFLKYYFPKCLIVDALPYGPPRERGASSGGEHYPGDDEAVLAAITDARRHGIARCRPAQAALDVDDVEQSVLPELIDRFGENPIPLSPETLERVVTWKKARDAGVGPEVRFVRYWHFPQSEHVVRVSQVSGRAGGEINDVSIWKTIGLSGGLEREMVALLERAEQSWSRRCVQRFREECQPGLMHPRKAPQREGLLKATAVANAAGVSAHRAMEERRLRALEGGC